MGQEAPPGVRRVRRFRLLGVTAAVIAVAAIAGLVAFVLLGGGSAERGTLKAAIVDQLSIRNPNQSFVERATAILEDAGYAVDYYAGDEVTVEAYRNLARQGYDFVLLRAHSAVPRTDLSLPAEIDPDILQRIMDRIGDDVLLFTSEPYDENAYVDGQKALHLFPVVYAGDPASDSYFAVSSGFVRSMSGRFDGATVVLMGCSGLATDRTAAAFVEKGADAVIGWSDTVSPEHTDAAAERLLRLMVEDGLSPAEATEKTAAELGPDPTFGAVLRSYP